FKDGYDAILENARISAQAAATAIGRDSSTALETVQRVRQIRASMYPGISVAYLPPGGTPVTAGSWLPLPVPDRAPPWMKEDVFAGSLGIRMKDAAEGEDLVVRSVVKVGAAGAGGIVVVDIPVDGHVIHRLHETTGVRLENVFDYSASSPATPIKTTSG